MNQKTPIFIRKYTWLLGQYIQNCLLHKEGIHKPEVEELSKEYPDLDIAGLINKQRDLYGVNFDWATLECIVRYKGNEYDITEQVLEIVRKFVDYEWINTIGFDTRGFDINKACKEATDKIINQIIEGKM